MSWDWGIVATWVSALAAVVALAVSCWQMRLNNMQSLFSRRLYLWVMTEKLLMLYKDNAQHLKQPNEPQMALDLYFAWLTNTTFLQGITPSISHPLEGEYQLKLHLKLDEMKSLACEARFVFKGKPGKAVADFLEAYQALLLSMYQYQVGFSHMQQSAKEFRWTLDEAVEKTGEKMWRVRLFEAEDMIKEACDSLSTRKMLGGIRRQIRLVSTPKDYIDTFR